MNSFLHSTIVSLHFRDVFVSRGDVKLGVQFSKVAAQGLELIVCKHDSDFKSSSEVCVDSSSLDGLDDVKLPEGLV